MDKTGLCARRETGGEVVLNLANEINTLAEDTEKMVEEKLGRILTIFYPSPPNGPCVEEKQLPEYFDILRIRLEGIKQSLYSIRDTINRVDL